MDRHARWVIAMLAAVAIWGIARPAAAEGDQKLAQIRAAATIRVANTLSSPPWTFLNEQNQPAGYDVDMARELVRRLNIPNLVFVTDSFKNFVEGLKADKYDLVMNDVTPTSQRKQQVDFSIAYGVEDFRIFVRKDNTDIRERADLRGKRVGVTSGSSNETWSRAHLKDADIRSYDNGGLLFADMASGRVDAVIISHFGGLRYAEVNHLPIKEVGEPLTYQVSAVVMAKGQPALKAAVDEAIMAMRADGTIERIGKKWVGEQYDMVGSIQKAEHEDQD